MRPSTPNTQVRVFKTLVPAIFWAGTSAWLSVVLWKYPVLGKGSSGGTSVDTKSVKISFLHRNRYKALWKTNQQTQPHALQPLCFIIWQTCGGFQKTESKQTTIWLWLATPVGVVERRPREETIMWLGSSSGSWNSWSRVPSMTARSLGSTFGDSWVRKSTAPTSLSIWAALGCFRDEKTKEWKNKYVRGFENKGYDMELSNIIYLKNVNVDPTAINWLKYAQPCWA